MKSKLALICRDVIIAADSGIPSAIHIVEGITPEGFPIFLPPVSFLTVWQKDDLEPQDHTGELRVLMNETEIVKKSVDVSFPKTNISRTVVQLQGLVIEKPCSLAFQLQVGDKLAEQILTIRSNIQVQSSSEKENKST